MDFSGRYEAAHGRWVRLLVDLDDDQVVPATPAWTVHDLLSHVVGLAADIVAKDLDDWASEDWTARQVNRRADRSRDEVLAEWADVTPRLCAMFDDLAGSGLDPLFARMAVVDLTVHEDDLRESIGSPREIDPLDWAIVGVHRREMLDGLIARAGLAPLRVRTDEGDDWTVGGDEAAGDVLLSRQELWRSLTGRRPRAVVRSYGWSVDPEAYVAAAWISPSLGWPEDADGLDARPG
jgi:uncharacterized protein (TIGR03083 family)